METPDFEDHELNQLKSKDFLPFEEKIKSKRWYSDYIDNLECNADVKNALKAILDVTDKCGETILHIGRIVVHIAISVAQKYPNTITGAILGWVISILVKSVPLLGWLIGPLLTPILVAVPAFMGFLADIGGVNQLKTNIKEVLMAR